MERVPESLKFRVKTMTDFWNKFTILRLKSSHVWVLPFLLKSNVKTQEISKVVEELSETNIGDFFELH